MVESQFVIANVTLVIGSKFYETGPRVPLSWFVWKLDFVTIEGPLASKVAMSNTT